MNLAPEWEIGQGCWLGLQIIRRPPPPKICDLVAATPLSVGLGDAGYDVVVVILATPFDAMPLRIGPRGVHHGAFGIGGRTHAGPRTLHLAGSLDVADLYRPSA